MACPFAVQWLDHHQIRGTACLLCQAFAFLLREFLRSPMSPVQRLDRRITASAETQRLALHRTRDIVRRACGQGIAGRPRIGAAAVLPRYATGRPASRSRGNRSGPAASVPSRRRQASRSRRVRRSGSHDPGRQAPPPQPRQHDRQVQFGSSGSSLHEPRGPGSPPLNRLYAASARAKKSLSCVNQRSPAARLIVNAPPRWMALPA